MTGPAYPKVPKEAWRTLRARAVSAPSTKFTPSTVAAMLRLANPKSARDNVVTPMKRLGLLDEDGALTPRGQKWRADASYPDACDEIIRDVYPDDLSALANTDGAPDPGQVKTWFDHHGFGESNARSMAATYVLIASKVLPEPPNSEPRRTPAAKMAPKKTSLAAASKTPVHVTDPSHEQDAKPQLQPDGPVLHLDIQIHIPADAKLEQIDQIFASMAKHLYGRAE